MFPIFLPPGNIGNLISLFSTIVEVLETEASIIPRVLEMRAAGGRLLWSGFPGLDCLWDIAPGISGYPGNVGNMFFWQFF